MTVCFGCGTMVLTVGITVTAILELSIHELDSFVAAPVI